MNTLRIKVLDESLEPLYKKRVNVEGDAGVDLYFPEDEQTKTAKLKKRSKLYGSFHSALRY